MEEIMDFEYTLASIPCPSDDHCVALGTAIRTCVMSKAITVEEMTKREQVIESLNKNLADVKLGCHVALCGPSRHSVGFDDSDTDGFLFYESTSQHMNRRIVFSKLVDLFDRSLDFEFVGANESEIWVRSICGDEGSQCKVVLQWGDEADRIRSHVYSVYTQQSPLLRPLSLALDRWMKEQQLGAAIPGFCADVAVIMAVFYLQKCGAINFMYNAIDPTVSGSTMGKRLGDVSDLALGFHWSRLLRFYAVEYNPHEEEVRICAINPIPSRRILMRDPGNPDVAIIPHPETVMFQNVIQCLKRAFSYFSIPRSIPGCLYQRILPNTRSRLCQPVVFHKFVRDSSEVKRRDLKMLNFPEWDPVVIAQQIKGQDWQESEDIKGYHLECIRVRMYSQKTANSEIRHVLVDDVKILNGILHPWMYKYKFSLLSEENLTPLPAISALALPTHSTVSNQVLPMASLVHPSSAVDVPLMMLPGASAPPSQIVLLDRVIARNFDYDGMAEEDYLIRVEVVADLQRTLRPLSHRLQIFGSSSNGFGRKYSDLDVYTVKKEQLDENQVHQTLSNIVKQLKMNPLMFQWVEYIRAEVPVVKFYHPRCDLEGDITCNNELALRNTQLLRTYADVDPRVRVLGVFLKTLAKIAGINETRRGYLSSYAFIIMLIHYLQRTTPPVLPVLQELRRISLKPSYIKGYDVTFFSDIQNLSFVWPLRDANKDSVGVLWLGFLHYYTQVFNGREEVISIRTLGTVNRHEKYWSENKDGLLAIEDPFIVDKNLAKRLTGEKSQHTLQVFAYLRQLFYEDCYRALLTRHEFNIPVQPPVRDNLEGRQPIKETVAEVGNGSTVRKKTSRTKAGKLTLEVTIESQLSTLKI